MLSNVTHSNFYFECNKERGPIDQLYIELGLIWISFHPHNLTHTRGTNQKASFLIGGVYDSNSLQNLNVKQYTYVFQKS